jgi:membrane protease YdiL (CAAX protease family)
MVCGAAAVVVAWRFVAAGKGTAWSVITPVTGVIGLAALATGQVELSPRVRPLIAALAGLAAGVLFYLATVAFVLVVRRWSVFDRHVAEIYDQRKGFPVLPALILASAVTAPGEELFWRGLFPGVLAEHIGWWTAAAATWAGYALVTTSSGSLPLIAGGIVGGAVWGALALWTHGVLAALVCHAVWTALMLLNPPGGSARLTRAARRDRAVTGR